MTILHALATAPKLDEQSHHSAMIIQKCRKLTTPKQRNREHTKQAPKKHRAATELKEIRTKNLPRVSVDGSMVNLSELPGRILRLRDVAVVFVISRVCMYV